MGDPKTGVQYLKSCTGVLKILEIILLIISASSVGYFWNNWNWEDFEFARKDEIRDDFNYIEISIYATAAAGGVALLLFLMFVAGVHESINVFAKIAAVIFFLSAILLFVVSGFLAKTFSNYKDIQVCKALESSTLVSQCEHLLAGAVCGFLAGVIFILDGVASHDIKKNMLEQIRDRLCFPNEDNS